MKRLLQPLALMAPGMFFWDQEFAGDLFNYWVVATQTFYIFTLIWGNDPI